MSFIYSILYFLVSFHVISALRSPQDVYSAVIVNEQNSPINCQISWKSHRTFQSNLFSIEGKQQYVVNEESLDMGTWTARAAIEQIHCNHLKMKAPFKGVTSPVVNWKFIVTPNEIVSAGIMLRTNLFGRYRYYEICRRTLFNRDKTTKIKDDFDETIIEQPDAIPTVTELATYKTKQYVSRLVTCRTYTPPTNLEQTLSRLAKDTIDNFNDEFRSNDNWKRIFLNNSLNKYNLLTRCMKEYSHTISNMTLNDLKTLEDVYQYFSMAVKDTNVLEDLQQSSDLPKNVHIQLDAVRFTPETSGFFNGLDAFPQRSTKIIDLWYKRKYPAYPKNEDDPFKDNIY